MQESQQLTVQEKETSEAETANRLQNALEKICPLTHFNQIVFPDKNIRNGLRSALSRRIFLKATGALIGGALLAQKITGTTENESRFLDFNHRFEQAARHPETFFRYVLEHIVPAVFTDRAEHPPTWHVFDHDVIHAKHSDNRLFNYVEESRFNVHFQTNQPQYGVLGLHYREGETYIEYTDRTLGRGGGTSYTKEAFENFYTKAVEDLQSPAEELVITFTQESFIPLPDFSTDTIDVFVRIDSETTFDWTDCATINNRIGMTIYSLTHRNETNIDRQSPQLVTANSAKTDRYALYSFPIYLTIQHPISNPASVTVNTMLPEAQLGKDNQHLIESLTSAVQNSVNLAYDQEILDKIIKHISKTSSALTLFDQYFYQNLQENIKVTDHRTQNQTGLTSQTQQKQPTAPVQHQPRPNA